MSQSPQKHFRVRFVDREEKTPVEVIVQAVEPSEFFGLVALRGFVFSDQKKLVILPEEDAARRRYGKTEKLHIPYHNLVFVEEFNEAPADLKNLPFLREVKTDDAPKEPM